MSFRLARFKEPMHVVAKQRRARRRKTHGKRTRFSHVTPKGAIYYTMSKTGERYTPTELKMWFGIQVKVPKKIKILADERRIIHEAEHA
jgi:hypothetical protein